MSVAAAAAWRPHPAPSALPLAAATRWCKAGNRDGTDRLPSLAVSRSGVCLDHLQQRHVLVHGNGVVDAAYQMNTGDTSFQVGQRLAIKPEHVLRMAALVEKLATGLRADL